MIDVVGQHHKLAYVVALLDAARRIGQHHRAHAQQPQHAHRKGDLERRVALVGVDAPLHDDDRRAAQAPRDQCGPSGPRRSIAESAESRRRATMTGSATASATAPSPEPSTMPTRGASEPSRALKLCRLCDLIVVSHLR